MEGSQWVGAILYPERNARGALQINKDDLRRFTRVGLGHSNDEERLIARYTRALLA